MEMSNSYWSITIQVEMFMGHYLAIPPYAAADLVFIYIIT